jgi:hypothetical protein
VDYFLEHDMSQISDTISRVGLDAAFQFVHGEPAFAVLRPLMTRPCRILPALAELGIETEADLLGFVGRLCDALGPRREAFLRLAAPVIDPKQPCAPAHQTAAACWAGQNCRDQ